MAKEKTWAELKGTLPKMSVYKSQKISRKDAEKGMCYDIPDEVKKAAKEAVTAIVNSKCPKFILVGLPGKEGQKGFTGVMNITQASTQEVIDLFCQVFKQSPAIMKMVMSAIIISDTEEQIMKGKSEDIEEGD